MLSFECPGTITIQGQAWVRLVVVGQSFMLHQIRKMVGMAVAVVRGVAPRAALLAALDPDRDFHVPMAPELGLFLDEVYYDAYNAHFGHLHGPLSFELHRDAAEAFKAAQLYPHIAATDRAQLVNALWLRSLNNAHYRFDTWESAPKKRCLPGQPGASKRARAATASGPAAASIKPGEAHSADASGCGSAAALVGAQETYGLGRSAHTPASAEASDWKRAKLQHLQQQQQQQQQWQQRLRLEEEEQQRKQQEEAAAALDDLYALDAVV